MSKFLDPNHLPCVQVIWRIGETLALAWNCREPFGTFYTRIVGAQQDNGLPVPTYDEIVDWFCSKIPSSWCTSDNNYVVPAPEVRPCRSCGRF